MTRKTRAHKLDEFRAHIDDIDRRIVALLNERTRVVERSGASSASMPTAGLRAQARRPGLRQHRRAQPRAAAARSRAAHLRAHHRRDAHHSARRRMPEEPKC